MYSEEETELRDLIMQNLESCGFLNKIKAEIRAGVFLALEEDGNFKSKVPLFNQKFDDFIGTSEGKMIISLIREFLDYYSLQFTLSIFEPEVASATGFISRTELCDRFNVKSSETCEPVLVTLLKDTLKTESSFASPILSHKFNSSPEQNIPTTSDTDLMKVSPDHINHENIDHMNDNQSNLKTDLLINDNDFKNSFNASGMWPVENSNNMTSTEVLKRTSDSADKDNKNNTSKESSDLLSLEHDPFFDEPLPPEKTLSFKLSESLKDKVESTSLINNKGFDDSKKSSLSSLKDLPSLTASHEWTFSRDAKNTLPSLDSLKSVSSSEASNEEIINLDPKENFDKKDPNVTESNESSEKQNSEESIEEEIEEDFSAGYDDLLNSSLSLADDVTTDQTISQVSVIEGVDHVEPCK